MKRYVVNMLEGFARLLSQMNLRLRDKLVLIFLVVKVIPIILLTVIAWTQIVSLGGILRNISVNDSSKALNDTAIENIERMTTDTANAVASFLYQRDDDILLLAQMEPSDGIFRVFSQSKRGRLTSKGEWVVAEDGMSWVKKTPYEYRGPTGNSSNKENDDMDGFRYRPPQSFTRYEAPLYDEIAFIDLDGNEIYKYVAPNSTKRNYPLNPTKLNVSDKKNTYVRSENYFDELKKLNPGEI